MHAEKLGVFEKSNLDNNLHLRRMHMGSSSARYVHKTKNTVN